MGLMAPGTVFAGHRIEALVGRGGMGVVYRARHLELDRIVALKVIAPDLLEDPEMRARFVGEARTAASIEHPHVIPLHYVGEEDGVAFLAMRFVEGPDVRQLVQLTGALAPARAADLAAQAAEALDAIHAAGFVHRDVKPANLLLGAGDHVYVTDFGLAKHVLAQGGPTQSGRWVGTLDYMSRRSRSGAAGSTPAPTSTRSARSSTTCSRAASRSTARVTRRGCGPSSPSRRRPRRACAGVPEELDVVVERALASKQPADRYPSAGDLGARGAGGDRRLGHAPPRAGRGARRGRP